MNHFQRQRLTWVIVIVLGIGCAVALALYALSQNINLYYSPSQIVAGKAPIGRQIRGGGMVVPGSLVRSEGLEIHFKITDGVATIPVVYRGILPDLFRENQAVVAQGTVDKKHRLRATQILAKHDENYKPPEVKAMLDKTKLDNDS